MKIHRPLWAEGTFLSSQQFQQQARWEAFSNDSIAQLCIRHPWGIANVLFDRDALMSGKLKTQAVRLRFADGTLIDSDVSDVLPLACDLHALTNDSAVVLLALPLAHGNGGNLGQGEQTERPLRYRQEWQKVQDIYGSDSEDMAVERHALSLRFAHDNNQDYITCPLARLVRDVQGNWTQDALLRRLPRQSGFTPLRRACVTMLGITTVAGIAALCLSATANRQLLRHIGDDLHQFYAVPAEEFITKARRLSVLKDDAVMLDGYYREGEPLRLGLGLYPGEQIRQPVLRAIRDYRPPEQKMEVTASLQAQTVRLDSMSLFDVGQARLKDGSTKVLVDALVNIRAKPGWLILVAGYTDATGDEKSNQQLSLRRAEAVRNWMLQTSDIPATCFAVQGLGESQPAATNDTPQGRAVNRRVEISLVPRSDACQDVK